MTHWSESRRGTSTVCRGLYYYDYYYYYYDYYYYYYYYYYYCK